MLVLGKNISLQPYNTFGINTEAGELFEIHTLNDLSMLAGGNHRILGGGSNVLLCGPVGTVLLNRLKGIQLLRTHEQAVWVEVSSGEVWHQWVMHAIAQGWGGIENLALIPGTVGAAPIQNIGAYGVEVKDVIESVTFWRWSTGALETLPNTECRFGYRDSIFKQELAGQVFITSVVFRLTLHHVLNTSYGAIEQQLAAMHCTHPTISDVANAVIQIRSAKLPDPRVTGNAGSFFKNPTIPVLQFEKLQQQYPLLPSYPAAEGYRKIPAGWLIEQAGWKGYREGDAGVHPLQALVLCNYGTASGTAIWQLSEKIVHSVHQLFGIMLEREVQIWGA